MYGLKRYGQLQIMGVDMRAKSVFRDICLKGHDEDFNPIPAVFATDAHPGSIRKVNVMAERLERGEDLFHEDDETRWASAEEQNELVQFAKKSMEARKDLSTYGEAKA